MAQLERQLGLRLLDRTPAGTHLTREGAAVADWAQRVVNAASGMMAAVAALRTGSRTGLRVASSVTVADHLLAAWLVMLHGARPDIQISLRVHNSATVVRIVESEEADVGFVEASAPPRILNSRVVSTDRLAVVVAPGHPWARRRRPLTGEELAATPLIMREVGSGTRDVLEHALASWGGVSPPLLELGSNTAILGAVRRNEGPAVISAMTLADDLASSRLIEVPTTGVDLSRQVRAVWRRGHRLSESAERLLRVARSSLTKAPGRVGPAGG
jgi:DNA-binding transcriptional LysR family regulator